MRDILSNTKVSLLTASAVSVLSLIVILGTASQSLNVRNTASVGGSSCITASELAVLNDSKANFETQIADVNAQIASTTAELAPIQTDINKKNAEIAIVQGRLLNTRTLAVEKYRVDAASATYLKLVSTPNTSSSKIASSKTTYTNLLKTYNSLISKDEINKSKIASLNADKLDLDSQIAIINIRITNLNETLIDLTNHLNSLNIAIEDGVNNPCQINESYCTDGIDNDKDGLIDCTDDTDCSRDAACIPTVSTTSVDGDSANNGMVTNGAVDVAAVDVPVEGTVSNNTSVGNISCNDSSACNYGSIGSSCEYISCAINIARVCNDDDECNPPGPVDHGICTEQCILKCDAEYSVSKTFLSALNPFGRDRYICSKIVLNSGICGGSLGSCPNHDYPFNAEATNNLPIEEQSNNWICGTHRCTL